MIQRWGGRLAMLGALCALGIAGPSPAVIPSSSKISGAVADANRAARRTQVLELSVELQSADGEVLARGTLLTHPSARARVELEGGGHVERHLRVGSSYQATRDGTPLSHPRPFLPPLALIQAASGDALASALGSLGAAPGAIALGRVGDHDCYVLGGRAPGADTSGPPVLTALWVDLESFAPLRIDRSDGIRYRLGPMTPYGDVQLPAWIEVQAPNEPVYRLVVRGAGASRADATAFGAAWLETPGAPAPAPADARAGGGGPD